MITAATNIAIQAVIPVIPEGNRLLTSNNPAIFETEPKEAARARYYIIEIASDTIAISKLQQSG